MLVKTGTIGNSIKVIRQIDIPLWSSKTIDFKETVVNICETGFALNEPDP